MFGGINKDLRTDQDFADAEKTVKWCGMVEERLAAAKQHALSQTASIDELFRTIDDISAEARRVRLDLDKLVTRRKVEVKEFIIKGGREAYDKHVQGLKEETGGVWVDLGIPDFAGAAKGKRSFESMQDAVDTMLANAKIDADASAKRLRANVAYLDEATKGYEFLFSDRNGLAIKQLDDLKLVVSNRVEKHKLDEKRKEEEQRDRIRQEEQSRADREAAERAAAEKAAQQAADSKPHVSSSAAPLSAKAEPTTGQAATTTRQMSARRPSRPNRPTEEQIVSALVSHFEATEEQVIGWLCELDFSAMGHAA